MGNDIEITEHKGIKEQVIRRATRDNSVVQSRGPQDGDYVIKNLVD